MEVINIDEFNTDAIDDNERYLVIITPDEELKAVYTKLIESCIRRQDMGIDLPFPETVSIPPGVCMRFNKKDHKKDLGVVVHFFDKGKKETHFNIVPRSSISDAPVRLANSKGSIDKKYTGKLIVALDNFSLTCPRPDLIGELYYQLHSDKDDSELGWWYRVGNQCNSLDEKEFMNEYFDDPYAFTVNVIKHFALFQMEVPSAFQEYDFKVIFARSSSHVTIRGDGGFGSTNVRN
jgi:dUTPase